MYKTDKCDHYSRRAPILYSNRWCFSERERGGTIFFSIFLLNSTVHDMISGSRGIVWNWRANDIRNCAGTNFSKWWGKKKKSRTVQVGTACINHPSIVRSKDGRERVSLLFELPFVLACLLPTAIVIVVNGFCTRKSSFSSYREIHAAKFNSSPPLPPNRRRKHSFSSRMESRSRERGAREDWWKGVGAVIGMKDGRWKEWEMERNRVEIQGARRFDIGNDVTKFRLTAQRKRWTDTIETCAHTTTPRFDSHDLSSSFFVHAEKCGYEFNMPWQFVASRAVLSPSANWNFRRSFPPHLPSVPPPLPLFSYAFLVARFVSKVAFRSHWDKSIFQL